MSPFEIGILMHYYCCASESPDVLRNPPIINETMRWFVNEGLLIKMEKPSEYGASYAITDRGRCWVVYVCNLSLPAWTMEGAP
jgi:hypothetical protein